MSDADQLPVFVFGPYNPKAYDSQLLVDNRREIESKYPGGGIIADCHFTKAKTMFNHNKIITPKKKPPKKRGEKKSKQRKKLSEEEIKYNMEVRRVRSRVEAPYGWLKRTFLSLSSLFRESEEQLKCLVYYAMAIYKLIRKRNLKERDG